MSKIIAGRSFGPGGCGGGPFGQANQGGQMPLGNGQAQQGNIGIGQQGGPFGTGGIQGQSQQGLFGGQQGPFGGQQGPFGGQQRTFGGQQGPFGGQQGPFGGQQGSTGQIQQPAGPFSMSTTGNPLGFLGLG